MEQELAKLVEEILALKIPNTGKIIAIDQTMLWQIVNFIILVFIFSRFLIKPIRGIIEKRHAKVNADIENAKKDKEEKQQNERDDKPQHRNRLNAARNAREKV